MAIVYYFTAEYKLLVLDILSSRHVSQTNNLSDLLKP